MSRKKTLNLVADIGNTLVKIAIFRGDKIIHQTSIPHAALKKKFEQLNRRYQPERIIISSVAKVKPESIVKKLKKDQSVILFSHQVSVPVKIKYKTPQTLGNDRLANAVAANNLFPGKNSLVIDAGTCLKIDFTDAKGSYHGGSISPGLDIRFRSLHTFTARLPLLTPGKWKRLTGRSTHESIYSGVYLGMLNEIKGMINQYREKYPELEIILTGGDMDLFVRELKNGIFADRFLTLRGLNVILEYDA